MGVQEISGHDWHNSSINSHVYWIALAPTPLSLSRFFPSLCPLLSCSFSPTLSFFLSLLSPLFFLLFSLLSPPPSVSFNLFVYRPTFLSSRYAALPPRLFHFPHPRCLLTARPFTSVVNPELVTSWTRRIPKQRLLIRQFLARH